KDFSFSLSQACRVRTSGRTAAPWKPARAQATETEPRPLYGRRGAQSLKNFQRAFGIREITLHQCLAIFVPATFGQPIRGRSFPIASHQKGVRSAAGLTP